MKQKERVWFTAHRHDFLFHVILALSLFEPQTMRILESQFLGSDLFNFPMTKYPADIGFMNTGTLWEACWQLRFAGLALILHINAMTEDQILITVFSMTFSL